MSSKKDIAIIFDCGATNVRVVAMDTKGVILAKHAMPNETDEDPHYSGGRIWDIEKLWAKLCKAARIVISTIDSSRIAGVTVTTFGVDGTLVDEDGKQLYPVISWQCDRTQPIMENIGNYISLERLYEISGVYPYAFNTINKLVWFKENKPELLEKANRFLFIPSLFIQKLTGVQQNDVTMLGTSMFADLKYRKVSDEITAALGVDDKLFGEIAEAGAIAGEINKMAMHETGIQEGVPVFFAGHDTQFAILGSGADLNQPVLSSGTWEILMTRSKSFSASKNELNKNLTTEADAIAGVFNIGQNWLGSGVLEWFSRNFYPELSGDSLFDKMINDAKSIHPGSHGLTINPAFYDDGSSELSGTINGLTINTTRGEIYSAFLESLAFRLREGMEALQAAGNFKAESVICVGGGSKNQLWNQLRADVCNLPIKTINQKETTVLGAALIVFLGADVFDTLEKAKASINYEPFITAPSVYVETYDALYKKYLSFKKNI